MVRFSVGLDLGAQQVSLAVYDYARQCSIPVEIGGDKTMPATVAIDEAEVMVGKRAESRSAKKCQGVLCAYRQMLYGMNDETKTHSNMCSQQWHFNVSADRQHGEAEDRAHGAGSAPSKKEPGYVLPGGKEVSVCEVMAHLVHAVCVTLLEAAAPGCALQVEEGEKVEWVSFAVGVPECATPAQRALLSEAVLRGARALGEGLNVVLVNETLAVAMLFCCIPPFAPKRFMSVDLGASKLTASLYEMLQVESQGGAGESREGREASGVGVCYSVREVCDKCVCVCVCVCV
jgi:molecular chaperone DnaK (HSP70)